MEYVKLGKTGLRVSRLCLGMMSYGSKQEREWHLDENEALPFVKRALDAGITRQLALSLSAMRPPKLVLVYCATNPATYQPHGLYGA